MKVELLTNINLELLQRLVQLEREAFDAGGLNEWQLVPCIRHGRVFIAREADEVLGLIQYMRDWENPRKAYLIGVSITKARRGKGLGTSLMRQSMQALKEENVDEVELTVDPGNGNAIRVYKDKLGFGVQGMRNDEYGAGEDRLVMIVKLNNLV